MCGSTMFSSPVYFLLDIWVVYTFFTVDTGAAGNVRIKYLCGGCLFFVVFLIYFY